MIDNDYREVDTDEKNVSDVEETKEGTPVETGEVVTDDPTEDNEKTSSKNIIKISLFFLKISGSFFERICYTVLVHICDEINNIEETQVKS